MDLSSSMVPASVPAWVPFMVNWWATRWTFLHQLLLVMVFITATHSEVGQLLFATLYTQGLPKSLLRTSNQTISTEQLLVLLGTGEAYLVFFWRNLYLYYPCQMCNGYAKRYLASSILKVWRKCLRLMGNISFTKVFSILPVIRGSCFSFSFLFFSPVFIFSTPSV